LNSLATRSPSVGLYTTAEVESRTGIPSTTLRQWERRYGLPNPQRGDNSYRLYSEADLLHLEFIQGRLSEGINISRAVELCLEHFKPQALFNPALELETLLSASAEHGLQDYIEELLEASLKADYDWAGRVLSNCYARFTVEDVLTHVIQPVLREVGELWQRGKITIAHEHQASAYLRGKLQILLDMVGQPHLGPGVIVACGPGETHEIGSLMLAVMLRRAGIRVFYLGADTPLADLVQYTQSHPVDAVLLSVGANGALAQLRNQCSNLERLHIPIFYGGAAFNANPSLALELGGQYLGSNAQQAVRYLVGLLSGNR
jgi:MerR family transcriptional regulator, light-induced transcriptional regulator